MYLKVHKGRFFLYNGVMNDYKKLVQILQEEGYSGKTLFDEEMKNHTTFKIGGKVPVFFEPAELDSLLILLNVLQKNSVRFFILGGGSNIVFCDEGFEGVVVSLCRINTIELLQADEINDGDVLVRCGAGTSMAQFVNFCTANLLEGAEVFAGLPGTLGGAVFMNARCFEKSISELFVEGWYIDLTTNTEQHKAFIPSEWDYKVSPFQNGKSLVLSLTLKLRKSEKTQEELQAENKKYIEMRRSKGHFDYPSAGSVFRNNHEFGQPSGKIIDSCGLKGKKAGGAQIAPFHGNFIINTGGATQKDVKELVNFTVNEVRARTGLILQPEIIFVDK